MIWLVVFAVVGFFLALHLLQRWMDYAAMRRTPPFADHEHAWRFSPDDDSITHFRRCTVCSHTDWKLGNEWVWVHPKRDASLMAAADRVLGER